MKYDCFLWFLILGQMFWTNRVYLLTAILGIVSLIGILILHLTSWRVFPDVWNNGECINFILETIGYSLLAACIFYWINDMIPKIPIWTISRQNIQLNIKKIRESLRVIVEMVEPFRFSSSYKSYTKEEFTQIFASTNLTEGVWSLEVIISDKRDQIQKICETLIGVYLPYMTSGEIKYIEYIMSSFFLNNNLEPNNFSVPVESRLSYYNNQSSIGESIIDLYLYRLPKQFKIHTSSFQVLNYQENLY